MVGKGIEPKSSRIFHQCYVKCCKLQNLTPLTSVIPTENGQVLDFCVDRIKYTEWPPILNALSCDLSLHSVSVKCRQQIKTVLEHIDCERLAKTVNKRAVILTKFMLSNLVEALSQLLSNTTLLESLLVDGLPLKIPYLNPLTEAILVNSSLRHLYFPRCLLGDAGCLALCKAVRCLPNILTLDLSGCELTPLGAGYIADLVKYQKIHRYSENWVHTLRYRMPELDTMAGLRRITLCGNPQLGDVGVANLLEVLADDLWIKALDVQGCALTELSAVTVLQMMQSNTTLVVLDMRHNPDITLKSLSMVRASLRANESEMARQFSWLSSSTSEGRLVKAALVSKNNNIVSRDRGATNQRAIVQTKYPNKATMIKKEKDYAEDLEAQLQEEISYRQQLEELNLQLVNQMRQLKQQQIQLWANNGGTSSGSEQSLQRSSRSCDMSTSSGSASSSVPIDQNTLSYIQRAFQDIYAFIKNNQCHCGPEKDNSEHTRPEEIAEVTEDAQDECDEADFRVKIVPKKALSTHHKIFESVQMKKTTKSAHLLDYKNSSKAKPNERKRENELKLNMIEKQMGDTLLMHGDGMGAADETVAKCKPKSSIYGSSPSSSIVSDSSDTLVEDSHRSHGTVIINPRDALCSSDEDD